MKRLVRWLCIAGAVYGGILRSADAVAAQADLFATPPHPVSAQSIEFAVPDARLRIAVRPQAGPRAVIYFGGNAEDVAYSLPELSEWAPQAAIYAMHYRGYGGSSGRPSQQALQADAQALYEHVRRLHPQVTVIGRSLGSALAVRVAATNPVQRLILITPFDSLLNVARWHFPLLPVSWFCETAMNRGYAPRIQVPTLVLVAEADEIVPRSSTDNLVRSFPPGICQVHVVPGADHNSIWFPTELIRSFVASESIE